MALITAKLTTGMAVHLSNGRHEWFADEEIFDIAAIAASRSFFTKLLDALGTEPDQSFMKMDDELRRALTFGRPISCRAPEYINGNRAA